MHALHDGELFGEQVLYHYEAVGTKLIIGKFCSIAAKTTFIMGGGGNHQMDGSTFPFHLFGHGWEVHVPALEQLPIKGDTIVGAVDPTKAISDLSGTMLPKLLIFI